MLFNSFVFALFLSIVWPVWRLLPARGRPVWLVVASLVFYGWWDWRFLFLLVGSALVDFFCARAIPSASAQGRRRLVLVSVLVNLGVLALFKYSGFLVGELNGLMALAGSELVLPALSVVLPVGLSFYTFQSMAYTIDVARGAAPARRFRDVLLYVGFFPQLVAGPIERSAHLMPQLQQSRDPSARDWREAVELFSWGLFKKAVVADNLAVLVQRAFDEPDPGGLRVLIGAYAFTWQIYCDFSGYSDMARGVARLFGVDLMVNFRRPFFAAGPQELWRRWHISLSQWLRDYLYLPLGGSRGTAGRTAANLLTTMILGGFWHGASWTFLIWGAIHGVALVLSRSLPWTLPRPLAILLTFHLTMLAFVVFRAHDPGQVLDLAGAVASGLAIRTEDIAGLRLLLLLAGSVLAWDLLAERLDRDLLLQQSHALLRWAVILGLWVGIALLGGSFGQPFLYFQF